LSETLAQADQVAVVQPGGQFQPLAVEVGAIGRGQVAQQVAVGVAQQFGVAAADAGVVHPDGAFR
jgi:hypothetical protein